MIYLQKYLRQLAQAKMKRSGVQRINKKRGDGRSYFAKNWRYWIWKDPPAIATTLKRRGESKVRRLIAKLSRKINRAI
jgi:hypothetical protein